MTAQTKATLKGYFNTGSIPSQNNFGDLMDSIQPRPATLVVAASNASAAEMNFADYVCDGTSDEVEINAAITALPTAGGSVLLTSGLFSTGASILVNKPCKLIGSGAGLANPDNSLYSRTVGITTIKATGAYHVINVSAASKLAGCGLRDFLVQGSAKNNGYAGIYTDNTDVQRIDNVHSTFSSYGFYLSRDDAGTIVGASGQCCGLGFRLVSCIYTRLLSPCSADNVGDATLLAGGLHISAGSFVNVSNGAFVRTGAYNAIALVDYTADISFNACKILEVNQNGFLIGNSDGSKSADRINISNSMIAKFGEGIGGAGTQNGVYVRFGRGSIISGNHLGTATYTHQVNGVSEYNTGWSDYTMVNNNIYWDLTGTGFDKHGAHSVDANNLVAVST